MNLPVLQPAIPCGNAGVTMNTDNTTTATNTLFSFDISNPPLIKNRRRKLLLTLLYINYASRFRLKDRLQVPRALRPVVPLGAAGVDRPHRVFPLARTLFGSERARKMLEPGTY